MTFPPLSELVPVLQIAVGPVILISGHPDASHVVLEHEPFVARIRKPITIDDLRTAIAKVVC